MTPTSTPRRVATSAVSALVTAAIILGAFWVQHARGAWPFAGSPTSATTPAAPDMASMDSGAMPDRVPVDVTPSTLQDLGIRLEEVRRESLTQTIQAVATVVPDESRISHVHTRVAGWVEQLDVNTTGEIVKAGQPLARVFSQELLSSQTEYLAIRNATNVSGLKSTAVESGRTRLTVLGMTPAEIAAIEESGEPRRLVTIVAPRSGVVINRGVTVGTAVDPSTPLLTVVDLSRVWVFAEMPEASIPAVRVGTTGRLDFPASGRTPFAARVDFLYPTLTERTRTLRVRFTVDNAQGNLRPGLYGTAAFELAGTPTVTVPRDAVVDTGRQQHVFVAINDRFEPRTISVGVQLTDRVEVRSGLEEGERIVSAGVFLLDSESRLRATGGMGGHAHGTTERQEPARPASKAPTPDPHRGHKE